MNLQASHTGCWHGFHLCEFQFEGYDAIIVFPKVPTLKRNFAIKTEYWNAFPEGIELALVEAGFHLCYIKNKNRWGLQEDVDRKGRFIRYIAQKYDLNEKVVPVGMSCGGMFAIKMACAYPELMGCLYLDAPLIQHMSINRINASDEDLLKDEIVQEIMGALELKTAEDFRNYDKMPIHMMDKLLAARIPAVLVLGAADTVLPYMENGMVVKAEYEKAGIPIRTYIKPNCDHHPHGMEDPAPVLKDILELI